MALYENIFIGTFLYMLGIEVGKKHDGGNSSVNLFQQTPADSTLSDLISSVNGKFVILEFKRESNKDDSKEKAKYQLLEQEFQDPNNKKLLDISHKCHFMAIGIENQKDEQASIHFSSYYKYFSNQNIYFVLIDFFKYFLGDDAMNKENKMKNILRQVDFLNKEIGVYGREFNLYIKLLNKIYSSDRNSSSGGLILAKNKDGELGIFPTNDIYALIQSIDQKLDFEQESFFHKKSETLSPKYQGLKPGMH